LIIDTDQIYREISKINNLLSTIDITEDPVFEEKINEDNKDTIFDAIILLKEKENQIRCFRQKLESNYFHYVNKNHLCAIMSKKTEK